LFITLDEISVRNLQQQPVAPIQSGIVVAAHRSADMPGGSFVPEQVHRHPFIA